MFVTFEGIGYEEYPQTLGWGKRVNSEKKSKKNCGDRVTLCDYIYLPPPPPWRG